MYVYVTGKPFAFDQEVPTPVLSVSYDRREGMFVFLVVGSDGDFWAVDARECRLAPNLDAQTVSFASPLPEVA